MHVIRVISDVIACMASGAGLTIKGARAKRALLGFN